ncbi:NAD(P)-dependent oxidoreductase [Pedobacter nototheniae]|uniref:NAD(P)-dependent oxidoreductase n=1 Tax=Pedobacter nototheniae TaxID=2488994 RepID=UPI0010392754|nr:NAD(P)H-binding protein [Pedobacter nototheniae]
MQHNIKVAVIGGTGKSGKYLVKALIKQGFQIKLLLRNPANFQSNHPKVEIINGNVNDYKAVSTLVKGCTVLISALGLGIPASETDIFSQATQNIIKALAIEEIERYIVIAGLNVDTPFDEKGPETKIGTEWMYANYPKSTADRQKEYDILSVSNLKWTLIRLPLIIQNDELTEIKVDLKDCPGKQINAANLANFLIEQITDDTYIKFAPFISNL